MKYIALALASLAVAAPALAQKAAPVPDLLKRALFTPAKPKLYAYDFENVSVNVDPKKGPQTTTVRGRIDPSRKKGDRVTIAFVEGQNDGKPITAKKMDENLEKRSDGEIFCDTFSKEAVTNVVDKGAASGGRLYTFTPRAEDDQEGEMKEIMKKMLAEAVVDEGSGVLKSLNATLTKKHNIMMIADMNSASMKMECQPTPDGRAYSARTEFKGNVSAFGQAFEFSTVQKVSNITPVG